MGLFNYYFKDLLKDLKKNLTRSGGKSIGLWFCLFIIVSILALIWYNILCTELNDRYRSNRWAKWESEPLRGVIHDRAGKSLASNKKSKVLTAKGLQIHSNCPQMIEPLARFLSESLELPYDDLLNKLNTRKEDNFLLKDLDQNTYNEIKRFRDGGGWQNALEPFYRRHRVYQERYGDYSNFKNQFEKAIAEVKPESVYVRVYPSGELTSHVVGFHKVDSRNFIPEKGIELEYHDVLKGKKGKSAEKRDSRGNVIPLYDRETKGRIDGYNLRLTLSLEIQAFVYAALESRIRETGAKGGAVIVLDSKSGEILAMASYPSFDPYNCRHYFNDPRDPQMLPRDQYHLNPLHNLNTQLTFEPGSVMKPFIMAWALEKGILNPDDSFEISPAGLKVIGKPDPIRDSHPPDRREYWQLDKIMSESSNVGMAQIGMKMQRENIIEGLKAFRFGERAIGFQEEQRGILNETLCEIHRDRPSWSVIREAAASFGKGVAVTPIQLAMAMNVFANDGNYVKPKILIEASSAEETWFAESSEPVRVISPETQRLMVDILEKATVEGTGRRARSGNYHIAGKTGTAEKPDRIRGGYDNRRHFATFVGFGPLPEPRYTIMVLLDEPTPRWGGASCGPLFSAIFENLMIRDGIPQSPDIMIADSG